MAEAPTHHGSIVPRVMVSVLIRYQIHSMTLWRGGGVLVLMTRGQSIADYRGVLTCAPQHRLGPEEHGEAGEGPALTSTSLGITSGL